MKKSLWESYDTRFFIFKAQVHMLKLYRLLNVLLQINFLLPEMHTQHCAACWMTSNEEVSHAVSGCCLICTAAPRKKACYKLQLLCTQHSCIYLLIPERLLLTSEFQYNGNPSLKLSKLFILKTQNFCFSCKYLYFAKGKTALVIQLVLSKRVKFLFKNSYGNKITVFLAGKK